MPAVRETLLEVENTSTLPETWEVLIDLEAISGLFVNGEEVPRGLVDRASVDFKAAGCDIVMRSVWLSRVLASGEKVIVAVEWPDGKREQPPVVVEEVIE
jgi:hypothetical protein